MPEHQKVQKRSQKHTSRRKEDICRKDSTATEEEMRKLQDELKQKEERVLFLSNKIDRNKLQNAEMAPELQSLQAGEERRGSDASQTGDRLAWRPCGSNLSPWERMELRPLYKGSEGKQSAAQGQMQEREEGRRRSSEDEQEQDKASQQLTLSGSRGVQ